MTHMSGDTCAQRVAMSAMLDRDVRNAVTVYALLRGALVGLDNLSDDMLMILYRRLELATEKYPDGEDAGFKAQNDVLRAFAAYVKSTLQGRFEVFEDYHLRVGEVIADSARPASVASKRCSTTASPAGGARRSSP